VQEKATLRREMAQEKATLQREKVQEKAPLRREMVQEKATLRREKAQRTAPLRREKVQVLVVGTVRLLAPVEVRATVWRLVSVEVRATVWRRALVRAATVGPPVSVCLRAPVASQTAVSLPQVLEAYLSVWVLSGLGLEAASLLVWAWLGRWMG
jgi:hypothetical protein